ncbi:MAG TPA: bile acid:sodium symporter [Gemmatimonadaceae bacterium]
MSFAAVVMLALKVSIALIVLGVGLNAKPSDLTYLLGHPALFARSFLAMSVILPLFTVWMARVFDLLRPVKVALVALALAPVPPFLPTRVMKAGGTASYTVGLLSMTSLLAIVVIPVSLWVLGAVFDTPFAYDPAAVLKLVGLGVFAPLVVGVAIRHFAPAIADRLLKPISLVATILLVAGSLALFVASWSAMKALLGNGTLLAIIVLAVVALAVGHVLGGPSPDDRTVLSLSTASRHPAVAIALASAAFPNEKHASAAVLLDLIVVALVSMPYAEWARRRAHASHSPTPRTTVPPSRREETHRWHPR